MKSSWTGTEGKVPCEEVTDPQRSWIPQKYWGKAQTGSNSGHNQELLFTLPSIHVPGA